MLEQSDHHSSLVAAENEQCQDSVCDSVPRHPFTLIEEGKRFTIGATQSGETIQVSQSIGRVVLALGVGMEHERTREFISRQLYPDQPTRTISSTSLGTLLRRARAVTGSLAPRIITKQGQSGTEATYYYEDTPPEAREQDFEAWNDESVCIRFDTRTGYLIISRNGLRTGARVDGYISRRLLEYLLRRPNNSVSTDTLHEHLIEGGHHKSEIGKNIAALRKYVSKRLGHDPYALLKTQIKGSHQGTQGLYTFRADRVEIIEVDGSLRIASEEPETDKQELKPVNVYDAAVIALGISLNQRYLQSLQTEMQQLAFPSDADLADLIEAGELPDSCGAKQVVADNITESLSRIRSFLDANNAQKVLRDWSPVDKNLKSLVLFLARFDGLKFTVSGYQRRGIDILEQILSQGG
jgi:hypothetical protein